MSKPRFNRSGPKVITAKDTKGSHNRSISLRKTSYWRPVSLETLGYLAATAKIGILQVHQRLGDKYSKVFAKSFLDEIDLYNPTKQDMDQIQLFSHLLFA